MIKIDEIKANKNAKNNDLSKNSEKSDYLYQRKANIDVISERLVISEYLLLMNIIQ